MCYLFVAEVNRSLDEYPPQFVLEVICAPLRLGPCIRLNRLIPERVTGACYLFTGGSSSLEDRPSPGGERKQMSLSGPNARLDG